MPREKPLYRDTLATVRDRAAALYPGQLLFGPTKVARILGRSRFSNLTVEQIASLIC